MSDFRYEIKTPLPVIWLENIDTKNPGWSVRNEQTMTNWSWLIRLKMKMLKIRPRTDPPNVLQCDLKKRKNIIHSSWSNRSSLYFTLVGNWLTYSIFLMWSQINVRSSIRLTGGRQIDFKVFKPFWMPRKYF